MSISNSSCQYNLEKFSNIEMVESNWEKPIEAFVKDYNVESLCYGSITNKNMLLNASLEMISDDEVLIIHETDEQTANKIYQTEFISEKEGICSLRDNCCFGWIFKNDIGLHSKKNQDNTILITTAKISDVYVSSYESSAKQLLLQEITPKKYSQNHVLPLSEYITYLKSDKDSLYNIDSLLIKN